MQGDVGIVKPGRKDRAQLDADCDRRLDDMVAAVGGDLQRFLDDDMLASRGGRNRGSR